MRGNVKSEEDRKRKRKKEPHSNRGKECLPLLIYGSVYGNF